MKLLAEGRFFRLLSYISLMIDASLGVIQTTLCAASRPCSALQWVCNWYEDLAYSSARIEVLAYGATIRAEVHREHVSKLADHRMSCELALVAGRPCEPPGCAESADPSLSCSLLLPVETTLKGST
jgi:hypothetical protein